MLKKCISDGWKFTHVPETGEYMDVNLPHDYSVLKPRDKDGDPSNAYFRLGCGKYIKYLRFAPGRHYVLAVDGAYSLSEVSLNENLLAQHPHGYTPFPVDLTDTVMPERTNKLVITTNPLDHSTRWYSGAGLYRDVFLYEGGAVRIEPWDLFVWAKEVTDTYADMAVRYTISSDLDKEIEFVLSVADGCGKVMSVQEMKLQVKAGEKTDGEQILRLPSPCLWDVDSPYLYTLKACLSDGVELLDESECTFGIKTFSVSVENGLILNGRPIKLRGGCIHHDNGALGARAYPAAEERKIRLLKEAGFNAVRMAHNPPSLAMLEACDRLGMLVMDEAFDVWNKRKFVTHDYHIFFREWWEEDIACMVRRDRNHPSVLSYSIGNEVYEIDGTCDGALWAERLVAEVKKHDPAKLVTAAIQKISLAEYRPDASDPEDYKAYMQGKTGNGDAKTIIEITKDIEKPLDIIGFNYYNKKFPLFHESCPDKVIWASENWHIGSETNIYDYWMDVVNNAYIIGDFPWTAIDHLGEVACGAGWWESEAEIPVPAAYPWKTAFTGDLDVCCNRRPQSYYRHSVWLGQEDIRIFVTHPKYFGKDYLGTRWRWYDVDESWTFDDSFIGKPIKCETYTGADYVLWYLNGREVGKSIPKKNIAILETVYEKGVLQAVAYKNGEKISECCLQTAEIPSMIQLTAESERIRADGRGLCFIHVSVTDENGVLIVDYGGELTCEVTGGQLLAFFSGSPNSEDVYPGVSAHPYKGKVLAVVSASKAGTVTVSVRAKGLTEADIQVEAM